MGWASKCEQKRSKTVGAAGVDGGEANTETRNGMRNVLETKSGTYTSLQPGKSVQFEK